MASLFHMPRSVLMSLLVIGATLAVVSTAFTFATFTDDAVASGDVTAGTIDVVLDSNASDDVIVTFDGGALGCDDNLAFGDSCWADIDISNGGSLAFDLGFSVDSLIETAPGPTTVIGCYTVSGTIVSGGPTGTGGDWLPTDTGVYRVTAELNNPTPTGDDTPLDNDCQGVVATIGLAFTATQSATPYD